MKTRITIIIIHQHFYPEPSGTAKPAYEIARYFDYNGYNVKVLTEFPNRNFKSYSSVRDKPLKYEKINGIEIFRIKNKFKYSDNVTQRILAYLWFTLMSSYYGIKLAAKKKNQIIFTIQAIPSAIPGALLNLFFRQKHIFYCTDMMPDVGVVSGLLKNKLLIKGLHTVEQYTYKYCTSIFAVTKQMVDEIKSRTNNPKIFELSDWLDDSHYYSKKDMYISELKNEYNLQGKKLLLYIGNIGFLQNIGVFIELAKKMQNEILFTDYVILIGGNGVQAEELKERVGKDKLNNIKFIGVVDRDRVPSFLSLSSCLLMNFMDHDHLRLYRSSKIFDYIIAEKPVLVGAHGALKEIVMSNNLGKVARPSDVDDLYNKLIEIHNTEYIIDNESLINKYKIDNILGKFEKQFYELGII